MSSSNEFRLSWLIFFYVKWEKERVEEAKEGDLTGQEKCIPASCHGGDGF